MHLLFHLQGIDHLKSFPFLRIRESLVALGAHCRRVSVAEKTGGDWQGSWVSAWKGPEQLGASSCPLQGLLELGEALHARRPRTGACHSCALPRTRREFLSRRTPHKLQSPQNFPSIKQGSLFQAEDSKVLQRAIGTILCALSLAAFAEGVLGLSYITAINQSSQNSK